MAAQSNRMCSLRRVCQSVFPLILYSRQRLNSQTQTPGRSLLSFLHPCVCVRARLDAFDCAHASGVRAQSRAGPARFLLPGCATYLPAHNRTQIYTKRTRSWGWTQRYGEPRGIETVPLSDPGVQEQSEGGIHLFRQ